MKKTMWVTTSFLHKQKYPNKMTFCVLTVTYFFLNQSLGMWFALAYKFSAEMIQKQIFVKYLRLDFYCSHVSGINMWAYTDYCVVR